MRQPWSTPLPDDPTILVALTSREIATLIAVCRFELDDTPDDFWNDDLRHDMHTAVEKLQAAG